jgi:hypothetical protein
VADDYSSTQTQGDARMTPLHPMRRSLSILHLPLIGRSFTDFTLAALISNPSW